MRHQAGRLCLGGPAFFTSVSPNTAAPATNAGFLRRDPSRAQHSSSRTARKLKSCAKRRTLLRALTDDNELPDSMDLQWKPLEGQMDLPLLSISMADGGDFLFPGTTETIAVADRETLVAAMAGNPPLFAHVVIDAWGVQAEVGSLALIMSSQMPAEEQSTCTVMGVGRFTITEIYPGTPRRARVDIFSDNPVDEYNDSETKPVTELEAELTQHVMDLMLLNIKVADNSAMGQAMHASEKNMMSFIEQSKNEGALDEVRSRTGFSGPTKTSEFLGFLVCDMLDLPFMERRALLESRDTRARLVRAIESVIPAVKELAARAAVEDALGK